MTRNIWDEKPEFPEWRTPYSTNFNHYQEILRWKKKEDAWLEKLREHDDIYVRQYSSITEYTLEQQKKLEAIRNLIAEAEAGTGIGDEFFTMSLHYTKLLEIIGAEK